MNDLDDDFVKFHDEMIFENTHLKAKLEALEAFVKSAMFLLFETPNYNLLLKEYLLNETSKFNDLSHSKQVYNSRTIADMKRDYLLNLDQQIEKLK